MPRKQKTAKKSVSVENREDADGESFAPRSDGAAAAKPAKKARQPSARKTPAARKSKTAKAGTASPAGEPSAEQIQLRAYFISEHRRRIGAPGDHHSDWLEARRQLMLEAQR